MRKTAGMGGAREIEHGRHGRPGPQRSGCGGRHGIMEGMGGMDDHSSSSTPARRLQLVWSTLRYVASMCLLTKEVFDEASSGLEFLKSENIMYNLQYETGLKS